jgi:hypothetical protein
MCKVVRKPGETFLKSSGCINSFDQGIKFCSKIQSARNHFKSNESIGLVVTNPTQLVWVQTDVGSERYRVLFKFTNRQKKGVLTVQSVQSVRTLTWQAVRHVAGHMTHGRQLFRQLACDMACLSANGMTTRGPVNGRHVSYIYWFKIYVVGRSRPRDLRAGGKDLARATNWRATSCSL